MLENDHFIFCQIAIMIVFTQLFHQMDTSFVVILLAASSSLSNLFIYCYFGKLATESFEQMSDCVYYDFVWHDLPIKLQKYVILMIANMQKPIYYHGFHFAVLNLCTFIQVSLNKTVKMIA